MNRRAAKHAHSSNRTSMGSEATPTHCPHHSVAENQAAAPVVTSACDNDNDVAMMKKFDQPRSRSNSRQVKDADPWHQDQAQGDHRGHRWMQPVRKVREPQQRGDDYDSTGPHLYRRHAPHRDGGRACFVSQAETGAVEK